MCRIHADVFPVSLNSKSNIDIVIAMIVADAVVKLTQSGLRDSQSPSRWTAQRYFYCLRRTITRITDKSLLNVLFYFKIVTIWNMIELDSSGTIAADRRLKDILPNSLFCTGPWREYLHSPRHCERDQRWDDEGPSTGVALRTSLQRAVARSRQVRSVTPSYLTVDNGATFCIFKMFTRILLWLANETLTIDWN